MLGLTPVLFLILQLVLHVGFLQTSSGDSSNESGESSGQDSNDQSNEFTSRADLSCFVDPEVIEEVVQFCVETVCRKHREADRQQLMQYARTRFSPLLKSYAEETPEQQFSRATTCLMSELYQEILRTIKEEAARDDLTGTFNRGYFENRLKSEIERADRYTQSVSLLLFDLDQFKRINDTHGHCAGDAVLKQFSNLLQNHLRSSDVLCRYGGDEFAVILPQTRKKDAQQKAQALLNHVRSHTFTHTADGDRISLNVTTSGGWASFDGGSDDVGKPTISELVHRADEALYRSKQQGRNQMTG